MNIQLQGTVLCISFQKFWPIHLTPRCRKRKEIEHRFTQSNSDCFDIQKLYENTGDFFKATYIIQEVIGLLCHTQALETLPLLFCSFSLGTVKCLSTMLICNIKYWKVSGRSVHHSYSITLVSFSKSDILLCSRTRMKEDNDR